MAPVFNPVLGTVLFASQLVLFSTDSMAGLSGQDSIFRAGLCSIDTTAGWFVFCAIFNFVFISDPNRPFAKEFALAKWRKCHSTLEDRTEIIKVSFRAKWGELQLRRRVATLHVKESAETPFTQRAKQFYHTKDSTAREDCVMHPLEFTNNLSQFVVPYMRDVRHSRQNTDQDYNQTVTLGLKNTTRAAALSVARYAQFIAYSFLLFLVRAVVTSYQLPAWMASLVVVADFGRWLAAVVQEQSILTYSCQYKGIYTWGSPERPWSDPLAKEQQADFRALVLQDIGRHYPAYAVVWVVETCWPVLAKIRHWPLGPELFSAFAMPSPDMFKNDTATIVATVYDEDVIASKRCYTVTFTNVPASMGFELHDALRGEWLLRLIAGFILLLLSIPGLLSPVLLLWTPESLFVRGYITLETVAINIARYLEVDDLSVNTKILPKDGKLDWQPAGTASTAP